MKRVLALVLTVVMLVSCMVFTALPASAAAKVHSVTLSNCDYSLDGLNGFSVPHGDLVIEGEEGNYVVRRLKAGTYSGAGSLVNFYYVAPKPVDLTGVDYLILEYYVSDAKAFEGKSFQVEMSNDTTYDNPDNEWERPLIFSDLVEGEWKDGWNTVKIPLSGAPAKFDVTQWRWFRVYNTNAVEINLSGDTIIGLRSFHFMKGEDKVVVNALTPKRPGWGSAMRTRFDEDEGRTYVGRTLTGNVTGNGAVMYFNRNNAYPLDEDAELRTVDASFAKYLCFDLYVSDAEAIGNVGSFMIEVNSNPAGVPDHYERQWNGTLNQFADYQLHDGWNHIMVGLDNEQFNEQDGNQLIDWSKVCWFRVTNNNAFELGDKQVDIGLDNIYFWDGYTELAADELYETITATGWKNNPYIIESDGAGKHGADFTFSDAKSHVTMKFDIGHAATARKVYLQTKTGSQLKLEVSMDNQNWETVAEYTENVVVQTRYYDISDLVDFSTSKTLYVKYSDSVPTNGDGSGNGNGGRMYNCRIDVAYGFTEEDDPVAPVIHSCDTASAIGGGWTFDDSIEGAVGKGCVSKTFTGNITNTAGFNFQVKIYNTKAGFWDTTEFEAVVFDLYVSNAAALKDTKFDIEFTSGKNPDNQENSTNTTLSSLVAEGTTWKDGWNTIVVPFSKLPGRTGGELNRKNFNYIRIFNQGNGFNAGDGLTVAWDNIHLWDGESSVYGSGRFISTKVQGFSVFIGDATTAKYDPQHPDDANANAGKDNISKQEMKYLVFTNASNQGRGANNGRFHDAKQYTIWKFDTKDALSAKFIITSWAQSKLSVSTDMTDWNVVWDTGTAASNTIKSETRTFDLTQYIDGDFMYVKVEDADPSNGNGFYVAPTGTYFVTTLLKTNDTSYKADVETSFMHWGSDGKYADYVVSEWWSGKTGNGSDVHPYFDRGHGGLQSFGGPQIVFAFPTNPNNKYAAVNLQVSSNVMIEISKDFINWEVYTAKANFGGGYSATWLDISDYVGGTDMIYIRVRSPEDLTGNGPQIHINAPIGFISQNEAPAEEILWDDCSNGDNVVDLFTYNEEFNGIGFEKTSGQTSRVSRYGKAGANPVDIRFMKWFEFDVYVSDPFPKGFNNQYVLELLDAPNGYDAREIQYTGFYLTEGWNHIVLPLPSNYLRAGAGSNGPLNMSAITSFRFFSVSEESSAEYTLVIKNLKFSRTEYVPNADLAKVDPNDTDVWAAGVEGFSFDIGDANVVELDVYSAMPEKLGVGYGDQGMAFEITSSGKCDNEEQQIDLRNYIYKAGWNHLIIPLKDKTVDEKSFDRTHVNYLRLHSKIGDGNVFLVRNIQFTNNDVLDADINMFAKLGDRPVIALDNGKFSLDLSGDKFVAFDLYLQDPELFMNNGGYMALELTSSNKCDVEEYQFTFGAPETHTYPNSIDVSDLTAGWNRIILPLRDALVTKGPVNDAAINYLRIHLHCNNAGSTAGAGWVAVRNFEGIALNVTEIANNGEGELVVVYDDDLGEGTLITFKEIGVPSASFENLEEGDMFDAIVDALYDANEDVFEQYDVAYFATAVLLDGAEGAYSIDGSILVKLGKMTLEGDSTFAMYTVVDGDLVEVEAEVLEEGGLTFEADDFKPYYLVAAVLKSKAGTTPYTEFEVTNTDEVFEEGTVVHVDVIKLSDADQDLLDTIQESIDEFQEEFEAGLTPAELAKNDYSYSTVAIYDVYALKDLAEVQPNGKVKMSIPAPALTAFETGKLFHIHDDGTKEEVEYTVNGNRWEFELDGFSNLVIVKVTAEPSSNPYTGDTLVVYIGLAVISMIALAGCAVLFAKKRKNNA